MNLTTTNTKTLFKIEKESETSSLIEHTISKERTITFKTIKRRVPWSSEVRI
jgi:hypothetical protein